jgi:hypothetical protein
MPEREAVTIYRRPTSGIISPPGIKLPDLAPAQLLALHAKLSAEYLFCKAFGWTQVGNSHTNIDAVGPDGKRYQIKGRRPTRHNKSRQLSAIRELHGGHFDFLAGILFNEDYTVQRAALIPHSVAIDRAKFIPRTNSHKFMLRDDIWSVDGVKDVTKELQAVTF